MDLIGTEKFDLILTHMRMPVMGGLELVKAIDGLNLSPKPHILVVTGGVAKTLEKEVRDDLRMLIDGYVLKPFAQCDMIPILKAVPLGLKRPGRGYRGGTPKAARSLISHSPIF